MNILTNLRDVFNCDKKRGRDWTPNMIHNFIENNMDAISREVYVYGDSWFSKSFGRQVSKMIDGAIEKMRQGDPGNIQLFAHESESYYFIQSCLTDAVTDGKIKADEIPVVFKKYINDDVTVHILQEICHHRNAPIETVEALLKAGAHPNYIHHRQADRDDVTYRPEGPVLFALQGDKPDDKVTGYQILTAFKNHGLDTNEIVDTIYKDPANRMIDSSWDYVRELAKKVDTVLATPAMPQADATVAVSSRKKLAR